jgi:ribonuclease HII
MRRAVEVPRYPDLSFERALLESGFVCVAGVDEAGRGAWAGPVVAGAVILPLQDASLGQTLSGVRDSKQMTARLRQAWDLRIREVAIAAAVGQAGSQEVDGLGLIAATRAAMRRALDALGVLPDHVLIDHLGLPEVDRPQTAITHGDARCLSIAAASVLAKVERDRIMVEMDTRHPGYDFGRNKGYGTPGHAASLLRDGPCPIHRYTYAPIAQLRLSLR